MKPYVDEFVQDAVKFFNDQSMGRFSASSDYRDEIEFTLSYRALDGRRFHQRYRFVVYFPQLKAWIEPVGSLLEASAGPIE